MDGAAGSAGAFLAGWWFGFGYFVLGLYWIANALIVDGWTFAWAVPFAVAGLPAVLGLFTGAALWLVWRTRWQGAARVLALALAWTALEWLRGHVLTGFPWNLIGYAWADWLWVAEAASVIGAYGLSLITVAVAAMPALLARPRGRVAVMIALAGLFLIAGAGWLRLEGAGEADVAGVRLRLVQGNVPQHLKFVPEQQAATLARYVELSMRPGDAPITHVIWPETALPYPVVRDPRPIPILGQALPRGGALITGAIRVTPPGLQPWQVWNGLLVFDEEGRQVAGYDKVHLVPFGEYQPLRRLFPASWTLVGEVDFSTGAGLERLLIPGAPPAGALICYEAIFPGQVVNEGARPAWLVNLTNDAWYGRSTGPYQHFAIARMRTIEEGLPLVRVANTGISGVVDAYGRVRARLGLDREGVIDSPLPGALATAPLYARWGDTMCVLLGLGMLLAGAGIERRRGTKK
ncbi:MAG: apolipoprotein N-acyltransferase [Proteobacteria bacterium]|nr:apolipoprotein N-acyltransferase [Pseudomonadota bacterium]MBI3499036.1 apolipoprotein N-acyltransferase [Pseudomonadota bacterium]